MCAVETRNEILKKPLLSSIKRTIMSWHPLDTDEEYQELFKQYGLDFDIDKEYLQ